MTTALTDIRYIIERNVNDVLDNQTIIQWMNDGQMDFGVNLYVPATAQIVLDTTSLSYTEPTAMKSIVRLWLQSDYDNGIDREYTGNYRRYNGKLIFPTAFPQVDTLNVDYYKQLKHFTDIADLIDIDDRFSPVYSSYGEMRYYSQPVIQQKLGPLATINLQSAQQRYSAMKQQVVQSYSFTNPDYAVNERW